MMVATEKVSTGLVGIDTIEWFANLGGHFCKITSEKRPVYDNWQHTPYDDDYAVSFFVNGLPIGLLAGQYSNNIGLLDVDERFSEFCEAFPEMKNVPTVVRDGGDKGKIVTKINGDMPRGKKFKRSGEKKPFFEWLSNGNQGIVAGNHVSGVPYRLINSNQPILELTPEQLDDICKKWAGKPLIHKTEPPTKHSIKRVYTNGDSLLHEIQSAVTPMMVFEHFNMANDLQQEGEWTRLKGNGGLFVNEDGIHWSMPGEGLAKEGGSGGDVFNAWAYATTQDSKVPDGHAFREMLEEIAKAFGILVPERKSLDLSKESYTTGFGMNDVGNSLRFVELNKDKARYVADWKTWIVWDGKRWERDICGVVMQLARETATSILIEAYNEPDLDKRGDISKWASQSLNHSRLRFMLEQSESQTGLVMKSDALDTDALLLNVQNGIVDLKTGDLLPHDPSRMMTKIANGEYDPSARSQLWEKVLREWTGGDTDFESFLQRIAGYTLIGENPEELFFLMLGPTATGKSTFLQAVDEAMGDYAVTANFETFLKKTKPSDGNAPRSDIVRLQGARLVKSGESDKDRELAEAIVKAMSGRDKITARGLFASEISFAPIWKIWMMTNFAPQMSADDDALWRRIIRVPFEARIPKANIDPSIKTRLMNEPECLTAILTWAIEGCVEYHRIGLNIPERIQQSTQELRDEMDAVGRFIKDMIVENPNGRIVSTDLLKFFNSWCEDNDEINADSKNLKRILTNKGYQWKHTNKGNYYLGISWNMGVEPSEDAEDDGSESDLD